MSAGCLLRQDEQGLRILANEYKQTFQIARTLISPQGTWTAVPLAESFSGQNIRPWLERSTQKLCIDGQHEAMLGEFGSEAIELKRILETLFPEQVQQS
jgi:hypothetical protein